MAEFRQFFLLLVVGALAGWIAALILRGRGLGMAGNVVVGVLGALGADALLGLVGFHALTPLAVFLSALGGAIVLLWVVGRLRPRRRR